MSEKMSPKKSRMYLILYSIALFSAAAVIILLSYLYSSRMEDELEESRRVSVGAMQSVESLLAENQELREQLAESAERLAELELEQIVLELKFSTERLSSDSSRALYEYTKAELEEMTRLYNELLQQQLEDDEDD